jgi:outer membrane immunogenic protein
MKQILFVALLVMTRLAFAGPESLPSGKEMKEVAPMPPPECNWTGFYVGVNAGGQFGHSENKETDFGDPWGYSESGVVGGGQVGYNWQWRCLVIGPEIDLGYMNLDGSGNFHSEADVLGKSDSDFYATFRGRLGVALGKWLIYGTGGAIGVNYDTRVLDPIDPTVFDSHVQDFAWGYTVGGGIERKLNCRWSIKVEYLYFSLDPESFSGPVHLDGGVAAHSFISNQSNGTLIDRFNGETTGHMVRAGLNFHF